MGPRFIQAVLEACPLSERQLTITEVPIPRGNVINGRLGHVLVILSPWGCSMLSIPQRSESDGLKRQLECASTIREKLLDFMGYEGSKRSSACRLLEPSLQLLEPSNMTDVPKLAAGRGRKV